MCGISGRINFNKKEVTKYQLQRMANKIAHRGPDGTGYFMSNDRKVGFAHNRLAIIDLTSKANQPMSFGNRYTITFNGEIYNYKELKKV